MAFEAKRQFSRKTSREAVKILSSRGVEYATFEDISAGGLKLWMERPAESGEALQLEFYLPYAGKGRHLDLVVDARVVRSIKRDSHYEVGVKFTELKPDDVERLKTVVDVQQGRF